MNPLISVPGTPNLPNTAAPATPRGRDAQAQEGRNGFDAALQRLRGKPLQDSETAPADSVARRRNLRAAEDKEASPAELLAMALLTPAFAGATAAQAPSGAPGDPAPMRSAPDAAAPAWPRGPLAGAGEDEAEIAGESEGEAGAGPGSRLTARPAEPAGAEPRAAAATPARVDTAAPAGGTQLSAGDTPIPVPSTALPATDPAAPAVSETSKAAAPSPAAAPDAAEVAVPAPAQRADTAALDAAAPGTGAPPPMAPALATLPALGGTGTVAQPDAAARHVPVLSLAPPVGSEEWGAALGTQMLRMNASGQHVAELNLNPAGLGPLKITLTIGEQQAQAMFVSAHESVRKAVEAALPQLRSSLADQGISLGQASVDAGPPQQQQQQASGGQDHGFGSPRPMAAASAPRTTDAPQAMPAARAAAGRWPGGGVDTFA